jgi:hypothetical protein
MPAPKTVSATEPEVPPDSRRFHALRIRIWLSFIVPAAIGIGAAEVASTGSLRGALLPVLVWAILSGVLERLRPPQTIVVTAQSLTVPRLWSRTRTVSLREIDTVATRTSSVWARISGLRYIYLRNGQHLTLNVLAFGSPQVAEVLALIGCAPTPLPSVPAA